MKTNVERARSFFEAYADQDFEAMLQLCAPTAIVRYVPLAEHGVGTVQQTGMRIWKLYADTFPDLTLRVISIMEAQNGSIVCEAILCGTQARDLGKVENKQRTFQASCLFILHFEQGLISNITAFWDNDTIYTQLAHAEAQQAVELIPQTNFKRARSMQAMN